MWESLPGTSRAGTWRTAPGPGTVLAGVAALALVVIAWRLDWARFTALGSVHAWTLLAVAALLQLSTLPMKALGWRATLGAVHPGRVTTVSLLGPVATGALFNALLPGRVGDAARILLVHARLRRRDDHAPLSVIVGSAITETIAATIAWVALIALAGTLVPLPPAAWGAVALVAVGAAVVVVAAWRGWGDRARGAGAGLLARFGAACRRVWATVAEGHRTLRRPRVLLPLGVASVGGWAAQWIGVTAVLVAFDVPDAIAAATLVLVGVSIAQTLPVLPGNVGVFQAAVALPLVASSGVDPVTAVAIGVVLQAVQSLPVAVAGAVATARGGEDIRGLWEAARRFDPRAARSAA